MSDILRYNPPTQEELDAEVRRLSARRSRRDFLVMAAAALGGFEFYRWLEHSTQVGMLQQPLRKAFNANAALSRTLFHERGLAPTYPVRMAVNDLRFNGNFGLNFNLKPSSWRLQVIGANQPQSFAQYSPDVKAWVYESEQEHAAAGPAPVQDDSKGPVKLDRPAQRAKSGKGVPAVMMPHELIGKATPVGKGVIQLSEAQTVEVDTGTANDSPPATPGLLLSMDDIRKFPHQDLVTQFKCIEGWSEIVHWGGVRLADLIEAYPPARTADGREPRYVSMETPDGAYYCGYDLAACRHPQSLLVYEMSGKPLNQYHGMPLRLHMPIKYGYKQIKQIGVLRYTDTKPEDFWTKLGYDWYAGL